MSTKKTDSAYVIVKVSITLVLVFVHIQSLRRIEFFHLSVVGTFAFLVFLLYFLLFTILVKMMTSSTSSSITINDNIIVINITEQWMQGVENAGGGSAIVLYIIRERERGRELSVCVSFILCYIPPNRAASREKLKHPISVNYQTITTTTKVDQHSNQTKSNQCHHPLSYQYILILLSSSIALQSVNHHLKQ
ncbi:hypothetical protein DFA_01495 [Cavenderia fasciculata]|uniref:Transmembrane protein n=1 Tax=Cavenderia fasciculata TaxID=261658 RepID=F4PT33_CACFS|nr:uncharacterized protein DFA_01495 [Cavenderia fasciculata]EGG21609.1 hypothetical protein DFA_01495 [Cavenderia fasciculata]|eukprot:XP_004359459.1 hypothetical protein DFA_01495 [Cavenderia fasciculata]